MNTLHKQAFHESHYQRNIFFLGTQKFCVVLIKLQHGDSMWYTTCRWNIRLTYVLKDTERYVYLHFIVQEIYLINLVYIKIQNIA